MAADISSFDAILQDFYLGPIQEQLNQEVLALELMEKVNLTRMEFQPYNLRSFYITQSILNGIDLLLIAKNCGNSLSTILTHYEFINMESQTKDLIKRRNVREEISNEVVI